MRTALLELAALLVRESLLAQESARAQRHAAATAAKERVEQAQLLAALARVATRA